MTLYHVYSLYMCICYNDSIFCLCVSLIVLYYMLFTHNHYNVIKHFAVIIIIIIKQEHVCGIICIDHVHYVC